MTDIIDLAAVFTRRQMEVAALIAQGLQNMAIAALLFIELRTVERHISDMVRRLGLKMSDVSYRAYIAVAYVRWQWAQTCDCERRAV